MIRATITITGDVQGAGYRSYLIMAARKSGLEGYAENLPNGVVNVVCEGEKEKIEEFVSKIKIKNEVVEVENIKVKYDKPAGEFKGKGFVIKVEESFKGLIQEMFQGYATSEKYFNKGFEKEDETINILEGFRMESKQSFENLNQNITGFREETKGEFQTIKTDYGKISQNMEKAIESINTIAKSIETLAKAIAEKR